MNSWVMHGGVLYHGSVPVVADLLPDAELVRYVPHVPGAVDVFDVRRACAIARREGRTHVPPCGRTDARGYCQGHNQAHADTRGT